MNSTLLSNFRSLLAIVLILVLSVSNAQDITDVANEIRIKIESSSESFPIQVENDLISCKVTVPQFYTNRFYEPAWNSQLAKQLVQAIQDSYQDGLNPEDYHIRQIEQMMARESLTTFEQSDFDLLLTDSYLLLCSHLMSGKVDPQTIDTDWKVVRREGDPLKILNESLEKQDVWSGLEGVKPTYKAYKRLKDQLKKYRDIAAAGGWEAIPEGETIKLNMVDERVVALRTRLKLTGDLKSYTYDEEQLYDETVAAAVKAFQKRHGLDIDGNLGKSTLATLNVPVDRRIQQIELNMERCRWLPQSLGKKYIMVNLPAFELELINDGAVEMEMIVATGKPFRQTPVFSAKMTYLVLNPYWTVPPTILTQDILPAQMKNPNYLDNLNIKVLGGDGSVLSASSIDWSAMNPRSFPYTLRQDPGKNNALGQVKFIFPNTYNIYMHDTNHPEVFTKADRALSSGCIRLSRPLDMAKYFLLGDAGWTEQQLSKVLASEQNYSVILKEPVQVHMQYWTAFVDETGQLNFRKDVYSRDDRVMEVLYEAAPRI